MSLAPLFRSPFTNIDPDKFGPTYWNQVRDLLTRILDTPTDLDGMVLTRDSTSGNGASWRAPTGGGGGAPPFGTGYAHVTAGAWDTPAALQESNVVNLVSDLAGKAPTVHTHAQADVTGLVTALAGKAATVHTHTEADITGLVTDLAGKAPTVHTHAEADVTGLVSDLAGKAPTVHSHAQADVTGLVTALAAKEVTANKNAASGYAGLDASSKLTGSQQVYGTAANTAAVGNDARLSDARTPTAHATSHKSGGGDAIALDELAAPSNVATLNVSISAHGLCPILPNDATKFLNGVGAFTVPAGGGGGSSDFLSVLTAAEIAITAATTATIGRMHAISGTSANYTITLPAASGNAGKFLGVRVVPAATKLYTLDGNASETIDGALTRILWANEVAILLCDGANWFKVGGKSIPMVLKASRALTSQTGIVSNTGTSIVLDTNTPDSNAPAAMWDGTNGRVVCVRPGRALVSVFLFAQNVSSMANINYGINGTGLASIGYVQAGAVGGSAAGAYVDISVLAVGDYLQPRIFADSGVTVTVLGSAAPASLMYAEVLGW